MVADSTLPWMFLPYTMDLAKEECPHVTSQPINQNTFHCPHASNSLDKTKLFIPGLETRQSTLGGRAYWLKDTESLLRHPLRKIPS